jgi:hypothetical protein
VAAVGTLALDHHEFTVTVGEGGAIALDFGATRGKLPPIVTAVRVTHGRISRQVDAGHADGSSSRVRTSVNATVNAVLRRTPGCHW